MKGTKFKLGIEIPCAEGSDGKIGNRINRRQRSQ